MAKKKVVQPVAETLEDMQTGSDFLNAMPEAGLSGALQHELNQYITALVDAKERVALAAAKLDTETEVLRKLQEEIIPDILARANLSELKLLDTGMVVFVKEDLKCAIPKDEIKAAACFSWLVGQGAGDIIKQEVTIPEVNDQTINEDLLDKLRELEIYYENKRTVNTNTLKAWFREKLGMKKGTFQELVKDDVPKEFSLYPYRKADIRAK